MATYTAIFIGGAWYAVGTSYTPPVGTTGLGLAALGTSPLGGI